MGNTYIIYSYQSPSGKYYIGKTSNEVKRKATHLRQAMLGSEKVFHKAIRKYGIDKFKYVVLVRDVPKYFIRPFEKYWINYYSAYSNGYNSTLGGDGTSGYTHSESTKQRIGAIHKGNTYWLGKKHTTDTLKKLVSKKLGNTNCVGRVYSSSTIKKMSDAHIGGKSYMAVPVINLDTGEIFASGTEASRALGLHKDTVMTAIRKGYKSGGYHWAVYIENNLLDKEVHA